MRSLIWFLAGAVALVIVVCGAGVIFLKTRANGFSARVALGTCDALRDSLQMQRTCV